MVITSEAQCEMCNVLFHVPQVSKRWGPNFFRLLMLRSRNCTLHARTFKFKTVAPPLLLIAVLVVGAWRFLARLQSVGALYMRLYVHSGLRVAQER